MKLDAEKDPSQLRLWKETVAQFHQTLALQEAKQVKDFESLTSQMLRDGHTF